MFYRLMQKMKPRVIANYQKGLAPWKLVLLLTTTGRKSGLPRVTPVQYEQIDGTMYIGSARGAQADWFRNIMVDRNVEVQIGRQKFHGAAEPICDPARIADLLELRKKRHPFFIGLLLRLEGLPLRYTRQDLERLAAKKAFAAIQLRQE